MWLFSDMLYMFVRYASPSGPMGLRCLMLTLSGPVELLFFALFNILYRSLHVFTMMMTTI